MSKLSSTIPLRTSVHPEALAKVNPRYIRIGGKVEDITERPTVPQLSASSSPVQHGRAVWEYDSLRYSASSSLPQLSLALTDGALPVPAVASRRERSTPVPVPAGVHILRMPVIPMPMSLSVRHTQSMTALPQWRDGRVLRTRSLETGTAHQRPIVRTRSFDIADIRTFPPLITHPHVVRQNKFWSVLDTLRWWLLAPGRLERILWLCGTLLLIMLTGALVWFFIVGWRYCAL